MKEFIPPQAIRSIIATVIAFYSAQTALAQKTYQVGVPVCDTIAPVRSYEHYADCGPFDSLRFKLAHPTIVPYVTGLSFQIIVTETNGRIWSNRSDTVKAGDIMPLPILPDTTALKVYLAQFSSFKFLTRVVGTPSVAHENFYCQIRQAFSTGMCGNYVDYFGEGPICQVQPATSVEDKEGSSTLAHFQLFQNYPNPFNPQTTIAYTLPKRTFVQLKIFDAFGQEVRTLANELQQAGAKSVVWDGKNDQGQLVSSGLYVYKILAEGFTQSSKAVLLK